MLVIHLIDESIVDEPLADASVLFCICWLNYCNILHKMQGKWCARLDPSGCMKIRITTLY